MGGAIRRKCPRGKVPHVNLESNSNTLGIGASSYASVLQREKKMMASRTSTLVSPRVLNNIHTMTPTAQPGTAVQYRAPARPREPHRCTHRYRDATLQSCEVYKVRLRPRGMGDPTTGRREDLSCNQRSNTAPRSAELEAALSSSTA